MKNLPSFIKDSTEFINLIEKDKLPTNCILATTDVSSLYTNLPHDEGRNAALLKHCKITQTQPEPQITGELIDIVLQCLWVQWNFLLTKTRHSHGNKMAQSYPNLFMGDFELQLLELGKPYIHMWKRFIEDIFLIWTGSRQQLDKFMGKINSLHRTIISHTKPARTKSHF